MRKITLSRYREHREICILLAASTSFAMSDIANTRTAAMFSHPSDDVQHEMITDAT